MFDQPQEALSADDAPLCGPAAALLTAPNPWSDWMAGYDVERLSWMRLAAMLMRHVPVPMVANRLATGLAKLQAAEEGIIMEMFEDDPELEGREVDWAFWLERWRGDSPLFDEVVREIDRELLASYGAELEVVPTFGEKDGRVTTEALLWFFLVAIRHWAERTQDTSAVRPAARWILALHRGDRASADPIAALLAHFYDRFRAGGLAPTKPLPATLAIAPPPAVLGVRPRRDKRAAH